MGRNALFGMRRAVITAVCLVLGLAQAALAADDAQGGENAGEEDIDQRPKVRLPTLIAPVVDDRRRLVGYAYISSQMIVSGTIWNVREKLPFIQNQLVHYIHANPLHVSDREDERSPERLQQAFLERTLKTMDTKHVSEIEIEKVIFTKH